MRNIVSFISTCQYMEIDQVILMFHSIFGQTGHDMTGDESQELQCSDSSEIDKINSVQYSTVQCSIV
jgi:hypothetical protein